MKLVVPVLVVLVLSLLLVACDGNGSQSAIDDVAEPTAVLKPPDADAPAASTCADVPEGDVVTITIRPDVPDPRCAKITAAQQLRVVNETQQAVNVKLAAFEVPVSPGDEWLFNVPVNTYLEPGVHVLQVSSLAGGAELWFVEE